MTPAVKGGIRVTVDDTLVRKMLAGARRRAADLSRFFRGPLDKEVTDFLRRQFDTEGAHGGRRWAPLSSTTLALRRRAGHGRGGVGRDTNTMWASLVKSGGPQSIRRITPREYERGSRVPWSGLFQQGWTQRTIFGRPLRRTIRVPGREVFPDPLPSQLQGRIRRRFVRYLEGKVS